MRQKILFAINDLSFGGGQMTLVEEANRLFQKGFTVYVLTLLPKKSEENFAKNLKIPAANIMNIPFRSLWDFRAFFKLVKFLRSIRPDFVFSNLFFTNTLIRLAKVFYPRMKIFVREGNLPVEKSWRMKIVDFFLSFLTKKIIVNAIAIKKSFKGILPQSKIAVIYNGIDEKFFVPAIVKAHKEKPVLISVGRISNQKGHEYLIRAVADFKHNPNITNQSPNYPNGSYHSDKLSGYSDYILLIVGDGSERKKLEIMVKDFNLEDKIKFLGSRGDVRELLAGADIFVLPSLLEGMPNAMLEAMAMGLPVVVTDVGGITEIVDNRKNGLVVKPKNADDLASAIKELIANPMLRAELGKAARRSVASWTWDNHLQALIKLIG